LKLEFLGNTGTLWLKNIHEVGRNYKVRCTGMLDRTVN
jgi:hypothetical protein